MAKRWTAEQDRKLIEGASANNLAWLRKQAGKSYEDGLIRSRSSVYGRARRLWGNGGLRRGVFSYRQLVQMSGYSECALRRAGQALGHRYRRLSKRGAYLITYEQREDIFAWLRKDYWSKALMRYTCVWCDASQRPHKGHGLCTRCWWHHRRLCARLEMPACPKQQWADYSNAVKADDAVTAERHVAKRWALPQRILQSLAAVPPKLL